MYNEAVFSNIPDTNVRFTTYDRTQKNEEEPGRRSNPHYHDEIELLFIFCGEFEVKSADEKYIAHCGDVIFINSRVPHETFSLTEETINGMLQITVSGYLSGIRGSLFGFMNYNENRISILKKGSTAASELFKAFDETEQEFAAKRSGYELYIKGKICGILGTLIRYNLIAEKYPFSDNNEAERILPVLDYIDENYEEKIYTDDLSAVLNLNNEYFCRLFKRIMHSTVTEYLNYVRVSKAERMLSDSDKTISEVSLDSGFSSVSYFNRIFKKYKNCSPSVYKRIKYSLQ